MKFQKYDFQIIKFFIYIKDKLVNLIDNYNFRTFNFKFFNSLPIKYFDKIKINIPKIQLITRSVQKTYSKLDSK
tara:strand:+ start:399 stop:620 length:222 start_codon:yes stop_codon:yes gene_type:complete